MALSNPDRKPGRTPSPDRFAEEMKRLWPIADTTSSAALAVSATPSTPFSVQYRVGEFSGDASAVAKAGRPVKVFQFETTNPAVTCDVSKAEKAAHLTAEIIRGGKPVFRTEAPEGTQGVRITHTERGWQQQTY